MKKDRKTFHAVAASLVVMFGFIFMGLAQDSTFERKPLDDPLPLSKQAKTIPISDTLITLKITVDGGEPIKATQREGGIIRIEGKGTPIYGFTPYINKETGNVAVTVFRITRVEKAGVIVGERITQLETLSPDKDFGIYANTVPGFELQLIDVKKGVAKKDGGGSRPLNYPQFETDTCCITCNGIRTCGCAVETPCGNCCSGVCCS